MLLIYRVHKDFARYCILLEDFRVILLHSNKLGMFILGDRLQKYSSVMLHNGYGY